MHIFFKCFFALFFFFCLSRGLNIGANIFYTTFDLTNQYYGSAAVFPAQAFYNQPLQVLRIDYFNPGTTTTFMSVYYNYQSQDQYEVCSGAVCAHATWTAPIPVFYGSNWTLQSSPACQPSDYTTYGNGPSYCVSNCVTYKSNPLQASGIMQLNFNDTGATVLCLARWTPAATQIWGPEWNIKTYVTSGFSSNLNPTQMSTYSSVISGVTCPQKTCQAVVDIALVIDKTASIGSNWPTVQQFVIAIISNFTLGPDAVRIGNVFFDGIPCNSNWTGSTTVYPSACKDNDCSQCGGYWIPYAPPLLTNKATLVSEVTGITSAGGCTCISCGMQQGINIVNASPRTGVQKMIILFTDGQENRVTGRLALFGKYAYDWNIKVVAVGVAAYQYDQLLTITNNAANIYTGNTFSSLQALLSGVIGQVCTPLPTIETCNFCTGLCACNATCECPTCNNINKCTQANCNISPVPQGTGGICTYPAITCSDGNPCTQDLCTPSTGCNYTVPTPPPAVSNNYCYSYICTNPQGFQYTDIGSTQCTQSSNLCLINYCNYTVGSTNGLIGSCQQINLATVPAGSSVSYKSSNNQTYTVAGCANPGGQPTCYQYGCNQATGQCTFSSATCVCITNSDCNDNNGCTTDTCDTVNNKCVYTPVDCWSQLSNGGCTTDQTGLTPTSATGQSYYTNGPSNFPVDANNLPNPNTGVTRSCDQLACYGGYQSSYTCVSTGAESHTCSRTTSSCQSSGCTDNYCSTLGTWTNNQYNTNCGGSSTYTCPGANKCYTVSCNTAFSGTLCQQSGTCLSTNGANRCPLTSNSSLCVYTDVCKTYSCLNSSGCQNNTIALPQTNACQSVACNPSTGNVFSDTGSTVCPQTANLCIINYCNSTTNPTCQSVDKTTFDTITAVSWVDSSGKTNTVYGCNKPAGYPACLVYGCDTTTGSCTINSASCGCPGGLNSECNDGNGCTIDTCVSLACQYTAVDCYSNLTNGACVTGTPFTGTNATGQAAWLAGVINPPPLVPPLSSCDALACYGGQRSQYTCQSTGNYSFTCPRTASPCTKGGCTDTICTTLGTWSSGQANTNCGTTYSPPCTSDICDTVTCNTAYVYPGSGNPQNLNERCTSTNNASLCQNGNACQIQGVCTVPQGCVYNNISVPTNPAPTCYSQSCSPSSGYSLTNIAATACPVANPADLCTFTFCDPTANQCRTITSTSITFGTSATYNTSSGNTITINGCGTVPTDPVICKQYLCNSTTGQCYQDVSNCNCLQNSNCYDGTGCTIDICNYTANACQRTHIDCISILSNGSCQSIPTQTPYTLDTSVGLSLYDKTAPANNVYSQVDANGLPSPSTGVNRTCAELGCYNGQPSQYQCFSTQEGSYTCQRNIQICPLNGCKDNICRTLGNWTQDAAGNWQINSDCGTTYVPNCATNNACVVNSCNSSWVPTDPVSLRCIHQSVNGTSFCDDGNFCTYDYCDGGDTSGQICQHLLYSQQVLRNNICPPTTQNTNCTTIQCTVNNCIYTPISCVSPNICQLYVCNATTNNTCVLTLSTLYFIDQCGVCGGDGTSCIPQIPANPKTASIAAALGVGLGVGLCVAAIIIGILARTGYSAYAALAMEAQGTVTNVPTGFHQGGDDNFDTNNQGGGHD